MLTVPNDLLHPVQQHYSTASSGSQRSCQEKTKKETESKKSVVSINETTLEAELLTNKIYFQHFEMRKINIVLLLLLVFLHRIKLHLLFISIG